MDRVVEKNIEPFILYFLLPSRLSVLNMIDTLKMIKYTILELCGYVDSEQIWQQMFKSIILDVRALTRSEPH